ncbi:hypothetical protein JOD57_000028 [Geodermatophilus bullaregiensis]|uniref:hypothetical protein n=1 Tax=Geodermatophilus bullaregiensis TaxID=1564160 RepID=UPI0019577C6D|nr:hypothetical protein [Geodermatophilus bullaregiensis]MBM7804191.1 hypothetical protein [Geodermatophilus bullaregiensis]
MVRWHLDTQRDDLQAAVLDFDALLYAESVAEELEARDAGLYRMLDEVGPAYELQYLEADKRPRDFVIRPVRIACQNVIVGLAAFAHEPSIDGMSVLAWQTCEVPHVATHEANRALAALMLCDAFASGGTMEIRFDRPANLTAHGITAKSGERVDVDVTYRGHPEGGRVPAGLRRYGRSVGVFLGMDDIHAISPREARDLFLAVTPMPADLGARVHEAYRRGVASPERLCFVLLSQIWREPELDFMLAVSDRTGSILRGGADWRCRGQRQAESEIARAALMIGMLYRRLDTKDGAGDTSSPARVLEDNRVGVTWQILPDVAAIRFFGVRAGPVPWQPPLSNGRAAIEGAATITVLPRAILDSTTLHMASELAREGLVAVVTPSDSDSDPDEANRAGVLLLRCPDRLGELDQAIERKLLSARISRA